MSRIRVAVLRGGPSSEYDVSLKTGKTVLTSLPDIYEAQDFLIDKAGEWHFRGRPITPERALRQTDVIFNALHGEYGEDGTIQRLLDTFGVPYTGTGPMGSALAMNKWQTKKIAESLGIKTPRARLIDLGLDTESQAKEIFFSFFQPLVVKPVALGSSVGVTLAQGLGPLMEAIDSLRGSGQGILVEEYARGKEATAGVVDNFRDTKRYALFPIEIRPPHKKELFDYEAKYSGETEEICPGNFSRSETDELQRIATVMHDAVNARHYSRSDFIVTPRGTYFLEINTLPGLTEESLVPKALKAAGATVPEFLHHVLQLALTRA